MKKEKKTEYSRPLFRSSENGPRHSEERRREVPAFVDRRIGFLAFGLAWLGLGLDRRRRRRRREILDEECNEHKISRMTILSSQCQEECSMGPGLRLNIPYCLLMNKPGGWTVTFYFFVFVLTLSAALSCFNIQLVLLVILF